MGDDGKPIVYQSPPQSPRGQEEDGDGQDPRKVIAGITSPPGSPQMTPEITPHYPQLVSKIPVCRELLDRELAVVQCWSVSIIAVT